jgi:isoleucyl-tRNA synthetase
MVTRLCQMLAPMLAFTAEEAWEFIPGKPTPSVHLSEWEAKAFEAQTIWNDAYLPLRTRVLPELEKARQGKLIGKSLDAKIDWALAPDSLRSVNGDEGIWHELLNVSQIHVRPAAEGSVDAVTVSKADGAKCERCWHWETKVGANIAHPTLCQRCTEVVASFGAR